jgi:hypothetical protein
MSRFFSLSWASDVLSRPVPFRISQGCLSWCNIAVFAKQTVTRLLEIMVCKRQLLNARVARAIVGTPGVEKFALCTPPLPLVTSLNTVCAAVAAMTHHENELCDDHKVCGRVPHRSPAPTKTPICRVETFHNSKTLNSRTMNFSK